MSGFTAVLAGATGLVGGECLRRLLASRRYERVIVLTRRELGAAARHRTLQQEIIVLSRLDEVPDPLTFFRSPPYGPLGTSDIPLVQAM